MMDHDQQRKGDVRVYIVSGLFFSCIVSGGVFLGLYMFLPETQSSSWYPIAGMVLVSIPWAFWFLTFAYRCFKPLQPPQQLPAAAGPTSARFAKGASAREALPIAAQGPAACESPVAGGSPAGGERKVQFGPVVVLGSSHGGQHDNGISHHDNEASEESNCSRESEMPLRLSV